MKEKYLRILCCPACRKELKLHGENSLENGEIKSGELKCSSCGKLYKINEFVPVFFEASE